MTSVAEVRLWGRTIGAVSLADGEEVAEFEYASEFVNSGIEVAALQMPLSRRLGGSISRSRSRAGNGAEPRHCRSSAATCALR